MSLFYEGDDEEEDEELTSNTQPITITLPSWLVIAIDERRGLAKRSTWITNDLEKKYERHKQRIIKEMHVGAKTTPTPKSHPTENLSQA